MVCINTPLGLHPPFFFPEKAGRDYKLSPYLEVLKDFRDDFTVISGLSHPDVGPSHDSNHSFLTAAPHPERRAGFKNSVSLDQFAADHIYGQTRFADAHAVLRRFRPFLDQERRAGADGGLAVERVRQAVSRRSPGRGESPGSAAGRRAERSRRRSRSGQEDEARSGRGDREKLDEYFTSVRELEQRLAQAAAWSKRPKPKVNAKPPVNIQNSADLVGKTRLWFDLIHLALQTDSSRLITLQLLGTSSVPPIPGVNQGHHDLSHHGQDPAKIAQLKILEIAKLKTLRDFLDQATSDKEEGESLLDRTMVFFSSNLGDAGKHSVKNMPVLLAGGGFARQHLAFDENNHPPLCNLYVSMLQRMGIEADKFGSGNATLTGLELRI